jgi:predicted nicotinamide N-methyase
LKSDYKYQLVTQQYFDLDILIPDPQHVKNKYENDQLSGVESEFPFWSKVWPSAIALTLFIENNSSFFDGRKVIELGAGLAIPSFVASRYASVVLTTDYLEDAVELMNENIGAQKLKNVTAEKLDWNQLPDDISADLIIMSDLNYSPPAFDKLFTVIQKFLLAGSTIVLATPQRLMAKSFIESLMLYIRHRETVTISDADILLVILKK